MGKIQIRRIRPQAIELASGDIHKKWAPDSPWLKSPESRALYDAAMSGRHRDKPLGTRAELRRDPLAVNNAIAAIRPEEDRRGFKRTGGSEKIYDLQGKPMKEQAAMRAVLHKDTHPDVRKHLMDQLHPKLNKKGNPVRSNRLIPYMSAGRQVNPDVELRKNAQSIRRYAAIELLRRRQTLKAVKKLSPIQQIQQAVGHPDFATKVKLKPTEEHSALVEHLRSVEKKTDDEAARIGAATMEGNARISRGEMSKIKRSMAEMETHVTGRAKMSAGEQVERARLKHQVVMEKMNLPKVINDPGPAAQSGEAYVERKQATALRGDIMAKPGFVEPFTAPKRPEGYPNVKRIGKVAGGIAAVGAGLYIAKKRHDRKKEQQMSSKSPVIRFEKKNDHSGKAAAIGAAGGAVGGLLIGPRIGTRELHPEEDFTGRRVMRGHRRLPGLIHEGIGVGDGMVAQVQSSHLVGPGEVQIVPLKDFAKGKTVRVLDKTSNVEAAKRAASRVGEKVNYNILGKDNCQTFAGNMRTGKTAKIPRQLKHTLIGAAGGAALAYGGAKLIARNRKEQQMSSKVRPIQFEGTRLRTRFVNTVKNKHLRNIAIGAGGLGLAGGAASAVFPDEGKTRAESIKKGIIKDGVFGGVLYGVSEPVIKKILRAKVTFISKLKPIRFAQKPIQQEPSSARDIAIGAVEGGAGILATDRLIKKFAPEGSSWKRKVAIGGLVGGAMTGLVGVGINRLIRKNQQPQSMSSKQRIIKFDYMAGPPTKSPAVAKDRYIKKIEESRWDTAATDYARTGGYGAGVGYLLRKNMGMKGGRAALAGAGAGLATEALVRAATAKTKDKYGEKPLLAKKSDRAVGTATGVAGAGIIARRYYKSSPRVQKLVQKYFSAKGKIIRFDDEPKDWQSDAQVHRWITGRPARRPKSVIQAEQVWKYGKRSSRFLKDFKSQTSGVPNLDARGRERTPEWKKPYFIGGAATLGMAGLIGGGHALRTSLRKGYAHAEQTGQAKSALAILENNISSGNIGRGLGVFAKQTIPVTHEAAQRISGTFGKALDELSHPINKKAGAPTMAITKKGPVNIEEERKKHIAEMPMEKIIGGEIPPEGLLPGKKFKLSARQRPIQFDQVYVNDHDRGYRRRMEWYEKKNSQRAIYGTGGAALATTAAILISRRRKPGSIIKGGGGAARPEFFDPFGHPKISVMPDPRAILKQKEIRASAKGRIIRFAEKKKDPDYIAGTAIGGGSLAAAHSAVRLRGLKDPKVGLTYGAEFNGPQGHQAQARSISSLLGKHGIKTEFYNSSEPGGLLKAIGSSGKHPVSVNTGYGFPLPGSSQVPWKTDYENKHSAPLPVVPEKTIPSSSSAHRTTIGVFGGGSGYDVEAKIPHLIEATKSKKVHSVHLYAGGNVSPVSRAVSEAEKNHPETKGKFVIHGLRTPEQIKAALGQHSINVGNAGLSTMHEIGTSENPGVLWHAGGPDWKRSSDWSPMTPVAKGSPMKHVVANQEWARDRGFFVPKDNEEAATHLKRMVEDSEYYGHHKSIHASAAARLVESGEGARRAFVSDVKTRMKKGIRNRKIAAATLIPGGIVAAAYGAQRFKNLKQDPHQFRSRSRTIHFKEEEGMSKKKIAAIAGAGAGLTGLALYPNAKHLLKIHRAAKAGGVQPAGVFISDYISAAQRNTGNKSIPGRVARAVLENRRSAHVAKGGDPFTYDHYLKYGGSTRGAIQVSADEPIWHRQHQRRLGILEQHHPEREKFKQLKATLEPSKYENHPDIKTALRELPIKHPEVHQKVEAAVEQYNNAPLQKKFWQSHQKVVGEGGLIDRHKLANPGISDDDAAHHVLQNIHATHAGPEGKDVRDWMDRIGGHKMSAAKKYIPYAHASTALMKTGAATIGTAGAIGAYENREQLKKNPLAMLSARLDLLLI